MNTHDNGFLAADIATQLNLNVRSVQNRLTALLRQNLIEVAGKVGKASVYRLKEK